MVCCKGTALTISQYCVPCVFRNRLICIHTRIWRLTTCSVLGALTCTTFFLFHEYMETLMEWLTNTDDTLCFVLFMALFMLFSLPVVIPGYLFLNMAAGFRYGFLLGTAVVVLCVIIGSTLAFLICKVLLSTWIAAKIPPNGYFQAIIQVVEGTHAFRVVAVTRLTPIPFGIQNGIFAISKIPASTFIIASAVGSFPNQVINAYMGSTMHDLAGFSNQSWNIGSVLVVIAQVCVSVTLSVYVVQKAQGHLQETIHSHRNSMKCLEEGRTISQLPLTLPSTSEISLEENSEADLPPGTPSKQSSSSWCNFTGRKVDNNIGSALLVMPT
ncbi:transmembrane protein 64-like [Amphiura filiformis]|uniref:transmembrane protein 64-like n=1 Tax=Amphiura filiformis TaxID=82378 RepID=UPI003B224FD4